MSFKKGDVVVVRSVGHEPIGPRIGIVLDELHQRQIGKYFVLVGTSKMEMGSQNLYASFDELERIDRHSDAILEEWTERQNKARQANEKR